MPTFVAANLKRVPDTPVSDTNICALTVNVLSLRNQQNDFMCRIAAFIELKNQVVELTDEVKGNKPVLRELRSEFVDVKSKICSMATQLKSIKSEMTSAGPPTAQVQWSVSALLSRANNDDFSKERLCELIYVESVDGFIQNLKLGKAL